MGNILSSEKVECINFKQLKQLLEDNSVLIINTMPLEKQKCLIPKTINAIKETDFINDILESGKEKTKTILIYGMNHTDISVQKKAKQLLDLGFKKINLYLGGMFEWLLLNDVYGKDEFPIQGTSSDILLFL